MPSKQFMRWGFLFSIAILQGRGFANALSVLAANYLAIDLQSQASSRVSISDRFKTLDLSIAQGWVGIGVMDLKSGESWYRNGDQRFPMQSVFKLPVGVVVLKLVDAGKLSLDRPVTVSRQDFAPGQNTFLKEIEGNSGQFTVQNLLE